MSEAMAVGALFLGIAVGFGLCEFLEGRSHRLPHVPEDKE